MLQGGRPDETGMRRIDPHCFQTQTTLLLIHSRATSARAARSRHRVRCGAHVVAAFDVVLVAIHAGHAGCSGSHRPARAARGRPGVAGEETKGALQAHAAAVEQRALVHPVVGVRIEHMRRKRQAQDEVADARAV